MTDGWAPVMLLVTVDDESRAVLDGELRRRYGSDYEVITCRAYDHARAILEGLRRWGREVAVVFSYYGPGDREGLLFLRRARSIQPSAKRAVVVRWGDFESAAPVFRAIAEGHAEFQLICSAAPPTVSHRTAACSGRRRPTGTRQASPSWAGWADHLLSCLIVPGRRTRARSMSAVRLVAR